MIKTNATFESQHKYTKELQRELEEMAHKGLSIPETVEVSPAVFTAMCQELNIQGARDLKMAVGVPHGGPWSPGPFNTHKYLPVVRVVPK